MQRIKVWDLPVRIFHWALVAGFAANALFTDPEHSLHHWIGYGIAGLVAFRLFWGLAGSRHARFADFPPDPRAALGQLSEIATGRRHAHAGHSPLGALMIYNLLATFVLICATGYVQTTLAFWGSDTMKEIHEAAVTWAEISVALHVAAVIFESRRLGIDLFRAMLTGYKEMPEPGRAAARRRGENGAAQR